jgi:hypothetical protein
MSVLGPCWQQAEVERRMIVGKKMQKLEVTTGKKHKESDMQESVHKESDSWKEEQHACMGGRPNVGRVRVLVIHCKWLKSPIYINIDT